MLVQTDVCDNSLNTAGEFIITMTDIKCRYSMCKPTRLAAEGGLLRYCLAVPITVQKLLALHMEAESLLAPR